MPLMEVPGSNLAFGTPYTRCQFHGFNCFLACFNAMTCHRVMSSYLLLMLRSIGGLRISNVQSSSHRYQIGRMGFSTFSLAFSSFSSCKQAVSSHPTRSHCTLTSTHRHYFGLGATSIAVRQPRFDIPIFEKSLRRGTMPAFAVVPLCSSISC